MGWLIDLEEELIFVYWANRTLTVFENRTQILPVPDFAVSIALTIAEIFAWLEN